MQVKRYVDLRSQGYKKIRLNSAEYEILSAHKYKNVMNFSIFPAQISLECSFFLLINGEMPTIVGTLRHFNIYEQEFVFQIIEVQTLTFISRENFMFRRVEQEFSL